VKQMGKCEKCGVDIDDRYKFCLKCKDSGGDKVMVDIAKTLEHINWNLGIMQKCMRFAMLLYLTNPNSIDKHEPYMTKMYQELRDGMEKDMRIVKDLGEKAR